MDIEKNVPFPDRARFNGRGGRRSTYPFMEMEVGDSVFFPGAEKTAKHPAYQAAKKYAQRSGDRKFSGVIVKGGVRIWRVL